MKSQKFTTSFRRKQVSKKNNPGKISPPPRGNSVERKTGRETEKKGDGNRNDMGWTLPKKKGRKGSEEKTGEKRPGGGGGGLSAGQLVASELDNLG